jgi:hypothetical protein
VQKIVKERALRGKNYGIMRALRPFYLLYSIGYIILHIGIKRGVQRKSEPFDIQNVLRLKMNEIVKHGNVLGIIIDISTFRAYITTISTNADLSALVHERNGIDEVQKDVSMKLLPLDMKSELLPLEVHTLGYLKFHAHTAFLHFKLDQNRSKIA